jgi:hypothetical protein
VYPIRIPYRFDAVWGCNVPSCEVVVLGRNCNSRLQVLIDSGATEPIFPISVAEEAGLDMFGAPQADVQFGGSTSIGWRKRVQILLQGQRLDVTVLFAKDYRFRHGMLGRRGIFDKFSEVAFIDVGDEPRAEFRISE